ncbi:MAG: AI-2E family transporter [Oscillospiraceae bacterium]|nr:AI-2E family transporter [Oscillospiraceae bacterium]
MPEPPHRHLLQEPLFRILTASGTVLLLIAFVILRYEGFFAALRRLFLALRPMLFGILFASMLNPSYERLRTDFSGFAVRHGRRGDTPKIRAAAVTGAVLPPVLILVSVLCVLIPQLTACAQELGSRLDSVPGLIGWTKQLPHSRWLSWLPEERISELLAAAQHRLPALLRRTYDGTAGLLRALLDLGIGAVLALYLLADKPRLKRQLTRIGRLLLPPEQLEKSADRARQTCDTFARFLNSQIKEALILGLLCWAGMSLLHFPYPVFIGVIIGITNIVPYLGPLIGTVPCALLLLLIQPSRVLWFLLFIVILQQVESNLIYPRVVGSSIGLPPAWVLCAIVVCGGLLGAAGLLLGVPLAAVIYAALFPQEA